MKKKLLILIVVILSSPLPWPANALENNDILANFLYNLLDYVSWEKKNSITLCSYGYDDIARSMDKIDVVHDRLSNVKNVRIITNIAFEEINTCNILYIANNKEKDIAKLVSVLKNNPILTISNIPNFTDYKGIIEFKLSRGKIKLKVNDSSLKASGLQISPTVLMAISPNQDRG